jgi:magnesium chelatase subunit I
MVDIQSENDRDARRRILESMLAFDEARATPEPTRWLKQMRSEDERRREELFAARDGLGDVHLPKAMLDRCADLGARLSLAGHRGEHVMALAARAAASIEGAKAVRVKHLRAVAEMSLRHRTGAARDGESPGWNTEQAAVVERVLGAAHAG